VPESGTYHRPVTLSKPALLADVLYSGQWSVLVAESEWVDIVHAINLGNEGSFHALYQRMHPLVFTLVYRITGDQRIAEQLTIDVFWDIWRRAVKYTPEKGTVVGWIMNTARLKAVERRQFRSVESSAAGYATAPAMEALSISLWAALTERLRRKDSRPVPLRSSQGLGDALWREVAPGITVKLLSADSRAQMVSMLVRLVPRGEYPGHTHAGREELHLLEGELWIDERKLHPGDYNRAEAGTGDRRVWSETGCMCVLITSTQDQLA